MRPSTCYALIVCLAAVPGVASAQSPVAPDVVVLSDGSMFRGTLVERSRERVVLMLPTGETRIWSPAEVQSAGRDTTTGEPTMVQLAPTASARPEAILHVRTTRPDLTLHLLDTSVSVPIPGRFVPLRLDAFHPFCVAPCDAPIEAGTYTFGISRGDGSAERAGPPLALAESAGSRSSTKIAPASARAAGRSSSSAPRWVPASARSLLRSTGSSRNSQRSRRS